MICSKLTVLLLLGCLSAVCVTEDVNEREVNALRLLQQVRKSPRGGSSGPVYASVPARSDALVGGTGVCTAPATCVPAEECKVPGDACAGGVCCSPDGIVATQSNTDTAAPVQEGSDDIANADSRSASSGQQYSANSPPRPQLDPRYSGTDARGSTGGGPSFDLYNTNNAYGTNEPSYNYPSDNYLPNAQTYGSSPYIPYGNAGPQSGYSTGYPPYGAPEYGGYGNPPHVRPRPNYGSFNHVFNSPFGYVIPDYYGPGFDIRKLSFAARDILHRYRYKKQCGVRPVFPALPYNAPYGSSTPYSHVAVPNFAQNPWQAAVLALTPRGFAFRCSATLVHPFLLLTSAQCLGGTVEPDLKVVLGVSDLLQPRPLLPYLERKVSRIFVHEEYDANSLAHDVALLQLASSVNFHFTPHITRSCLPVDNQTFVATSCYIVGWSNTDPTYRHHTPVRTNEIKRSDMKFIGTKLQCQQEITKLATGLQPNKLTDEMHCIKGVSADSCLVPAGGSLFCDVDVSAVAKADVPSRCYGASCPKKITYLAGVVSWSNQKCGEDSLAIITELSPYVRWITDLLATAGGYANFNPSVYSLLGQGYGGRPHDGRYSSGYSGYGSPGHGDYSSSSSSSYSNGQYWDYPAGWQSSGGYGSGGYGDGSYGSPYGSYQESGPYSGYQSAGYDGDHGYRNAYPSNFTAQYPGGVGYGPGNPIGASGYGPGNPAGGAGYGPAGSPYPTGGARYPQYN